MTVPRERVFFIWVTALCPDLDHAVTDEEMAARNLEIRGEYRALCGAVFLPAPDRRPPGQPCPECGRHLRAPVSVATPPDGLDHPRLRAPGSRTWTWLRRGMPK